jgi:hypothetical protein
MSSLHFRAIAASGTLPGYGRCCARDKKKGSGQVATMRGKTGALEATNGATGMDGLAALHQRHLDAMTGAVKAALDSAHTIANRQCDAVAEAHRRLAVLLWRGAALPNFNGGMNPGLDFVKRAFEMSCAQTIALTEIATKAQMETLAHFGKSVADGLDGGKDPDRAVGD